jgi:hypothetical protein
MPEKGKSVPRPVYIICSESGSEDRQTALFSFFNIIEKIQIENRPADGEVKLVGTMPFRATAVWMATDPEDWTEEYEAQMVFLLPRSNKELVVYEAPFRFGHDMLKPMQRFTVAGYCPPLDGPGFLRIESRIRKRGESNWLKQDYPIIVEVITSLP